MEALPLDGLEVPCTQDSPVPKPWGAAEEGQLENQKLWLVRWGTMAALVWSTDERWAEERTRRQVGDRHATGARILRARVVLRGQMTVRQATTSDIRTWQDAGGPAVGQVTQAALAVES